ncbi:hypothetical protein FB451DRAFT_1197412 [Mycena latifolia]|nr:hypothetical protein FB451DRAFT_1197412 [Mycena latifolia]
MDCKISMLACVMLMVRCLVPGRDTRLRNPVDGSWFMAAESRLITHKGDGRRASGRTTNGEEGGGLLNARSFPRIRTPAARPIQKDSVDADGGHRMVKKDNADRETREVGLNQSDSANGRKANYLRCRQHLVEYSCFEPTPNTVNEGDEMRRGLEDRTEPFAWTGLIENWIRRSRVAVDTWAGLIQDDVVE